MIPVFGFIFIFVKSRSCAKYFIFLSFYNNDDLVDLVCLVMFSVRMNLTALFNCLSFSLFMYFFMKLYARCLLSLLAAH